MKKLFAIIMLCMAARLTAETVADEGAWCWFADPRAVHNLTLDGHTNYTYIGYIDTHGAIKAMQYDFNRHKATEVLVRSAFQPDDHNNPTFLVVPDGRVMVMYSRHTDEPCFYYRITADGGDLATLGEEHLIHTDHNTTYPSPFVLSSDPTHFYLCWRGINWHPTIAKFTLPDDHGKVVLADGPYQIVQSTGARPYAKYASDGRSRIYLAYTTGHPDNENPNYLYCSYIDIADMSLHSPDGTLLAHLQDEPFKVSATETFTHAYGAATIDTAPYRDWVWQLVLDEYQRPVVAFTRISPDKKSHNYHLARWDGKEWQKKFIAYGGAHFHQSPDIEHCYSGGIAIDPDNPLSIYCSVPVKGANGSKYEIINYRLDTNWEVKDARPVTANSTANCVRPYVIPSTADSPLRLIWMQGDYYDWIVSRERPQGYPTAVCSDFPGFTYKMFGSQDLPLPQKTLPYVFNSNEDFTISTPIYPDSTSSVLLDLGTLKYCFDPSSLRPEVRYGKKTYRSTNALASSDCWKEQPRATNGKWPAPTPLADANLTFEYSGGTLRTYINGALDQTIVLEAPKSAKAQTAYALDSKGRLKSSPTDLKPDYKLSPLTGLTRSHWIEAAQYLLDGAFSYIESLDDPMYFPKQIDKTYPRDEHGVKVAKLEGLARTFFIAAPLLRENPDLTASGFKVADYYRHQILGLIDPDSPSYEKPESRNPSQTLLELASICISLELTRPLIWDTFTPEQRDSLAALFKAYGEGPTIASNWKFFNLFALSFLKHQGYEVNEQYLEQQITDLLAMYRGEGWYNDAPAYDYYSMWAFQTYGPLWAHLFGDEMYPEYARQFKANQADMVDNYPYMFARDGRMNMWGRSLPYRFACVAPLALTEWGTHPDVNYGWLRHISSATLLQFLSDPSFLSDGVPTMGFYGPFAPAVQIYSCRGSVYWLGKAFFCLLLPSDSQFWTATENIGPWADALQPGRAYNKFQPATNLMITDYPNCGGAEMRAWCKERLASDWQKFRSSENYNRLAYHTEFPWMADGPNGEISMNYGILNSKGQWEVLRLYDFVDYSDGAYRRDAELETDARVSVQLTDIPLADGVLRIDRVTVADPTDIRLGSYSLPLTTSLSTTQRGEALEISNGHYHLATVPLYGWTDTYAITSRGLHPVADECAVIQNAAHVEGTQVFVTLHLWQKGDKPIPAKVLEQVQKVEMNPEQTHVHVTLADGTSHCIDFAR